MVSHGRGGALARSPGRGVLQPRVASSLRGFDSAIISRGVSCHRPWARCACRNAWRCCIGKSAGSQCRPRRRARATALIALSSIAKGSDRLAAETQRVAEHSPQLSIDALGLRRRRVERNRNCSSAAHICSSMRIRRCRVQHDGGHARLCSAASSRGGSSQRYILSAKCMPGILSAVRLDRRRRCPPAGTFCASQSFVRGGKGDETSPDCRQNNEKTKARRKGFALRYLRQMMGLPWNQPKAVRLAWQARRSSLLGRRTEAERLYSDHGHRGGARLATFARTRIRGFEEVLRARDGRT
ncbi:hypothetical protein ABIF38_000997 [Bradyrhizobium japonicum]|uniref:Uncharacterized protein n=1 Tax=Bradyrhizobium elkanii TaxID=29448 RepID=A0ABV4ERD4_BRAEL